MLIVDDEPTSRTLLAELAAREGYEVLAASGGAEALALMERELVDLLVLDMMMPGVDGLAILAELQKREKLPALPVVVVTANDDRELRIDALKSGAVDFITKPINGLEFACRLRTHAALRRQRERAVSTLLGKVKESEHLLRLHLGQSPFARIALDTSFRVVDWNPAAAELFGYTSGEALGQRADFIVPEAARTHVDAVWRELLEGRANESTNENVTKDGRTIHCEWHNAPLTSVDGTLLGVSSAVIDVTERVRLQAALAQSQKMDAMGSLAGGIAHDFSNILAVILSYGSFIRDALPVGDRRRADVIEVLKAGERAAGLTRQLLAFSRQQPMERKPVDLNQSLAQVHQLLVRTLGEHVVLMVVPSAQPAVVRIDPVQFDQITLNLAVNARDAMPDGGQLRIALEHPLQSGAESGAEAWVHLTVTDTGVGMDEQTQRRIFEHFFTTKAKGGGTGLGLATCFGIVAEAGGFIRVRSAPGQGTTFTVELPLCAEEPESNTRETTGQAPRGRGEVVLVAEDDVALRSVATRVLGSAGFTVHAVADGIEGKKKLDELGSRLDLLFSDVVMPGCSGYDLAEHAGRVAPQAAVILTSGFVDRLAKRKHREDLPTLWKPVTPRDLVRAVTEALAARPSGGLREGAEGTADGLVLVVEDDEAARKAMVRVLDAAGYSSTVAATLTAARMAFETGPQPQLVLCDLSLPDGSGAELLEWLWETHPALCQRVFVLTGGVTDEAGRRVTSSGHFRVLPKPIQPQQLLEVLAGAHKPAKPVPESLAPTNVAGMPSAPLSSRPSNRAIRRERVLLVDDDEQLARSGRRTLSDNFDVVAVDSLGAARTALAETEYDALVLDLGLPDGNGLELLRELRGKNSELPVVMVTGALSTEAASQAMRSRVSEYLSKPFAPSELLRAVRAAADAGRLSRLRTKLLAARFGGDDLVRDLEGTEKSFALALPEIRMVYQPIVRAADSSVFAYEALMRSEEPSMTSPQRLFAAAELLGRVEDVGRVVRARVATAMLAEPTRLEAIFLNIRPSDVRADLLAEGAEPLVAMAPRVVLEISEVASLEGGPRFDAELAHIRGLGYRLALDDLGAGYAGLSSLVHLHPDFAKIDMSLVRDIHRLPLKRDIVAALVDVARRAGIVVVAKGIETVEERDTLVDLGCDLLQGYLFAAPGPAFPIARTRFSPPERTASRPPR